MTLKFFGDVGCGTIVLNDDATNEEIAAKLKIAATEESGNGKEKRNNEM